MYNKSKYDILTRLVVKSSAFLCLASVRMYDDRELI